MYINLKKKKKKKKKKINNLRMCKSIYQKRKFLFYNCTLFFFFLSNAQTVLLRKCEFALPHDFKQYIKFI